jgi:hypothetical protein
MEHKGTYFFFSPRYISVFCSLFYSYLSLCVFIRSVCGKNINFLDISGSYYDDYYYYEDHCLLGYDTL